ncbi:MAG: EAL domain-containing protein [Halomonadaceae bacterium]|nr:MAG: EAL domain-containing protein [Halomonadaceae bacterium]
MARYSDTIRLLLLDPSQNDAETLVSVLRNAGRATRAHRITSEDDLLDSLANGTWDLILLRDQPQEPTPDQVLAQVHNLDKDIPCLLLTDQEDRERQVAAMEMGAQDVLPFHNQSLLRLVIDREMRNLEARRGRRLANVHLQETEQRCRLLLESSKDAIAYINDGMHVYGNGSYLALAGYDESDDLIGVPILDVLTKDSQEPFKKFMRQFADTPTDGGLLKCQVRHADKQITDVIIEASAATYDGEPCTQIVLRPEQNNTELEEKLRQISNEDVLTGLFNRQHLVEKLNQTIASVQAKGHPASLAFIALDNLVAVKTQVGIPGTDLIIGDIANLLKEEAREGLLLSRLSDDAFALLDTRNNTSSLQALCENLRRRIADHLFDISGRTVQMTVSIGIAPITDNAPKAMDLLGRAHSAADQVREQPGQEQGNGLIVYTPELREGEHGGESADAILQALEQDRFRLLFQPIINLRDEGEEHYEAFVRMLTLDGEEVSPYDFLPPSGPTDMAARIDRWVVLKTIRQLTAHREKGHDTRIFLTLTAETLQDPEFTPWLRKALNAARLPGDALIFQISEKDATTYLKQIKGLSKALQKLHCGMALTQFGGAINPFNTLKHLDVAYVKLDGSYTEEIQKTEEAKKAVKEMVQTLQQQGKLTIIPLVENAAVLALLWQAGVNFIQGYYLQAPSATMNYDFTDGG